MATWVLLRGLMREQRHWGDFPARMARAMPGAQIITLDMPGNGSAWRDASPTRVAGMVDACRAELRQRRCSGPFHLLALSLGAMVAAEWGARHAHEIAGAVLINTSMRPLNRFGERLRWQNYPALLRGALFASASEQAALILRLTSRDPARHAGVLADWLAWQAECPVSRANMLRQLLAAARFRAPADKPAYPVLVVGAGGDRLVDVRCSHTLAQRWRAPMVVHPSAGHDLPLDEGDWLAQQVQAWHAGLSAGACRP